MKTINLALIFALFGLTSCAHTGFVNVAHRSDSLRLLLIRYHESTGHFPNDLHLLKTVNPQFDFAGALWNNWDYASWDADQYSLWIYPGPTRQSLWLKMMAQDPKESGWFVNNDDGNFIRQDIPLLPEEIEFLATKPK